MMIKVTLLVTYLLVAVNAGTYGGKKIGLEDIEKDYNPKQKLAGLTPPKASSSAVASPTKFGFVPKRTADSYAATKPKTQYQQTTYRVKPSHQAQPAQYEQQYTTQYAQPQIAYQQQYSIGAGQQYAAPSASSEYAQQYSSHSQQSASQQQAQEYTYVQPDVQQQYTIQYQQPAQQYQQPAQQYQQYENVQYVTDNSLTQPEAQAQQQYYSQTPQPQYYFVQQYQSPSTAVESVLDPKAVPYITYVPSYSPNSIPIDEKQLVAYAAEPQLPPVTTTVAKYTAVVPKKSGSKQNVSQKDLEYAVPFAKQRHYHKQEEILIKREPKSLLDSYVPSIVQLQYLKQQGKSGYSKF